MLSCVEAMMHGGDGTIGQTAFGFSALKRMGLVADRCGESRCRCSKCLTLSRSFLSSHYMRRKPGDARAGCIRAPRQVFPSDRFADLRVVGSREWDAERRIICNNPESLRPIKRYTTCLGNKETRLYVLLQNIPRATCTNLRQSSRETIS